MIDGKPRIGDEVYIHGYIDEIRNDVIIIRNEGGYFGTSDREMFYYEEDERGYGTMNEADRKTENSSEKPNNCEHITEDGVTCARYPACDDCHSNPLNKVKGSERLVKGTEQTEPQYSEDDMYWLSLVEDVANGKMSDAGANQAWLEYINHKDEPTISKMEQVETMSCQECKHFHENAVMYLDQCDFCFQVCKYEPKDEPQSLEQFRVGLEYHTDTTHFGKTKGESITTNKVKDEPQKLDCRNKKYYSSCEYANKCHPTVCFKALDEFKEKLKDEPQTERSK